MDVANPPLYNWKAIEDQFTKQLNITSAESNLFFRYAAKYNYSQMNEYMTQVKEGTITKANAQRYWLNKLPYLIELYKFKYLPFVEKEKQEETTRLNKLASTNRTMSTSCNNLDFSSGDLSNWVGQWNNQGSADNLTDPGTGQIYGYGALDVNGLNSSGFNSMAYVHELCNGGTDPNVPINRVPPGHSYSVRLGTDKPYENALVNAPNSQNPYNHQTISNTFSVTAASQTITYWYAVVLDQAIASPHPPVEQPYFRIRMYDGSGNEITCARYDVNVTEAASIGGFDSLNLLAPNNPAGGFTAYYKNWTPVFIPLDLYMGQNVTITFESSDCDRGGHFGYAYLAVDCAPLDVITTPAQPCIGGNTILTAPAGLATYNWVGPGIVGSNTVQIATANIGGTYSVTMTTLANAGQTGCSLTLPVTFTNSTIAPIASFTATTPCLNTATHFTDESTVLANQGTLSAWSWNFGDGLTSTANNPTHVYATPGTYPVTYTITSSVNCTASYSTTVVVNPLPTASFTVAPVCGGTASTFTNASTGGISYNWHFGDGIGTSTNQSPVYTYANAGIFAVTLTVTNTFSCQAVATNSAIVNTYPLVNYTAPTVCFGSNTVFNNTSTPATGATYSWNFGDISTTTDTSSTKNPIYHYPAPNTYSVTLTVTTAAGCVSSKTNTLSVNPIPAIMATSPSLFCWNDVVTSPTVTNIPSTSNPTYVWTNNNTAIGLNGSGTGIPPTFTAGLNNTGSNIIGVISITPHLNGCVGLPENYNIIVKPTPIVTQPSLNYCPGDTVPTITFSATPAAATANITWSTVNSPFIGLSTSSGTTTLPMFYAIQNVSSAESNIITLNDNLNGCVGPTTTFSITVNSNPTAKFTYANACDGNPTNFMDQSIANSGTITQWNWNFGTGTATGHNPNFLLTPAGTYTVSLQVTSDKGCKHDTTETVVVKPSPIISFTADTMGCTPFSTTFTDVVQSVSPVTQWNWNFGNTAIATYTTNTFTSLTYTNASHTQSSFYSVTLSVNALNGCITTLTKYNYIQVYPKPLAGFTYNPKYSDIIDPTVNFVNQSIGASGINAYNWNFGDIYETVDSLNYSAIANPTHMYSTQTPSDYTTTLVVTNTYGCVDSTREIITIHDAVTFYIPNAFSPNGDLKNEGFKGTGIGIDEKTYNLWIFDRWGLLIFHATDLETAWDGHVHGSPAQEDVYVWKVSFTDDLTNFHEYHGTVTLIK